MNQAIINNTRKNLRFEVNPNTGAEKTQVGPYTIELKPEVGGVTWFLRAGTLTLDQGQTPARAEAVTEALAATFA